MLPDVPLLLSRAWKATGVAAGIVSALHSGVPSKGVPVYLDIGSRGGLPARWRPVLFAGLILPVYVEPDPIEAANMTRRFPRARLIRAPLGAVDGYPATLHVTREPGRSSLLEPDSTVISAFSAVAPWEVVRREPLTVRRLDQIWGDSAPPTFVKVDVQGYELEVLQGMGSLLESVVCLEAETSLVRFYRHQATFSELQQFLDLHGFDLVRIAALGLYRRQAMVEFNTFWVRRGAHDDPKAQLWKRVNDVGNSRRVNVYGY